MCRVNAVNEDSVLLSHHAKKPNTTSSVVSATAQQPRLCRALARLVSAGFTVDTDGQRLKIAPAALLTAAQRDWIQAHKSALVAAVSMPRWRWCVEYPDGRRYVVDCVPECDLRDVARNYAGAAVWPAPDDIDVATWIDTRRVAP